jgi:hypothetical protein
MWLLLVEIALTIWAWNRGWKAKALIPAGFAFCIGFVAGVTGNATPEFMQFAAVLDISAIIALGFMIYAKKE